MVQGTQRSFDRSTIFASEPFDGGRPINEAKPSVDLRGSIVVELFARILTDLGIALDASVFGDKALAKNLTLDAIVKA